MAQKITVEKQVLDVLHHTGTCDLEEVTRQCANLTWNHVFFAVDCMSRRGEVRLLPRGRGTYTVAFPLRQEGRRN